VLDLLIADLAKDAPILLDARHSAHELLENDPDLASPETPPSGGTLNRCARKKPIGAGSVEKPDGRYLPGDTGLRFGSSGGKVAQRDFNQEFRRVITNPGKPVNLGQIG
jgi:hypothetical protein